MLAGAVATILVGYRLAVPPSAASVAWGAYLALAAALTIGAGGALAAADDCLPELPLPTVGGHAAHRPAAGALDV